MKKTVDHHILRILAVTDQAGENARSSQSNICHDKDRHNGTFFESYINLLDIHAAPLNEDKSFPLFK